MYERNNVIRQFEKVIANYCGSPYAVAVESCTAAIFLSCLYYKVKEVRLPKHTYHSVPASVIHAGGSVYFKDFKWKGLYQLYPYPIIDSACRFRRNMYKPGTLHCLSFQYAKPLPVGRGGMILLDNKKALSWFQRMRIDGRREIPNYKDKVNLLGWNFYITPEQAARGLALFYWRAVNTDGLPDCKMNYSDLSKLEVYKNV